MGSIFSNEEWHHPLLKKSLSYPLYALLPIILIHFYFDPFSFSSPTITYQLSSSTTTPPLPSQVIREVSRSNASSCDYSQGEWVPDNEEPLYNGTTCDTIKKGQNCMAYGRPDKGYLYWKWCPKHCQLPRFDPHAFLKLIENKHIAFVGDSLARNQLESLLCMTATAAKPNLFYTSGDDNKFRKWRIPSHSVNVSVYWSPFLVRGIEKTAERNFNSLFLDSANEIWAADLEGIDVLVLSVGHWYLLPAVYYDNNTVVGCHFCGGNHTEVGFYDVYGRALSTVFQTIMERRKGASGREMNVFLTTFTPAHFEGEWDAVGACARKRPFGEEEGKLEGMNEEMRRVGVERVEEVKKELMSVKVRLEALDVSKMAMMRPDGHPGPYMNPFPFVNGVGERVQNDCVHWCLPGPIDAWNQILMDLMSRCDVAGYQA